MGEMKRGLIALFYLFFFPHTRRPPLLLFTSHTRINPPPSFSLLTQAARTWRTGWAWPGPWRTRRKDSLALENGEEGREGGRAREKGGHPFGGRLTRSSLPPSLPPSPPSFAGTTNKRGRELYCWAEDGSWVLGKKVRVPKERSTCKEGGREGGRLFTHVGVHCSCGPSLELFPSSC
jgi:hypothetical protein